MRVLFKEDDPMTARTLERQLRKLGHATERITDIDALLSGNSELEPDVIITDIFMPDVEGLEFIRMIKRSPLGDVPIIAISGGGSYMGGIPNVEGSFVAKAAVTFGALKFLRKPVSLEALQGALDDCVGVKSPNS
ncbi:MAG: response regulator [Erythrobacter sp.]|jgi:CheY-like chemotaxis protein